MTDCLGVMGTCGSCKYSRTYEIYDPVVDSMKDKFHSMPEIDIERLVWYNITKCYFQGAPQKVNANKDWCYRWEEKESPNLGI